MATAARVQYVVSALPQPLRETIAESYYDGRTYQETARRLGISEQAAKQRMRLGLALLATELEQERERHRPAAPAAGDPRGGLPDARSTDGPRAGEDGQRTEGGGT